MTSFFNPDQQFNDNTTGSPLALGVVYFGQPNQDPETNQKQPYSDAALTTPVSATQTLNAAGKFAQWLYLDGDYSLTVRSSTGALIYSRASLRNDGGSISFSDPYSGLERSLENAILSFMVPLLWFIPEEYHADIIAGTSAVNIAPYLTAAFADARVKGLYARGGTYQYSSAVVPVNGKSICGDGKDITIFQRFRIA